VSLPGGHLLHCFRPKSSRVAEISSFFSFVLDSGYFDGENDDEEESVAA
jgi:hypothetical protein